MANNGRGYVCPNCGTRISRSRGFVLHLLTEALERGHPGVTTADFLKAGAGSRFGARIHELRHDHGVKIHERTLPDRSGSMYTIDPAHRTLASSQVGGYPPGLIPDPSEPLERTHMCLRCVRDATPPVCERCGTKTTSMITFDFRPATVRARVDAAIAERDNPGQEAQAA